MAIFPVIHFCVDLQPGCFLLLDKERRVSFPQKVLSAIDDFRTLGVPTARFVCGNENVFHWPVKKWSTTPAPLRHRDDYSKFGELSPFNDWREAKRFKEEAEEIYGPLSIEELMDFPIPIGARRDESVIYKRTNNGLRENEVRDFFWKTGCVTPIITGIHALKCVYGTIDGAIQMDLRPYVVTDCLADKELERTCGHEPALFQKKIEEKLGWKAAKVRFGTSDELKKELAGGLQEFTTHRKYWTSPTVPCSNHVYTTCQLKAS